MSDCNLCGKYPRRRQSKYCEDCRQVIRRRYTRTYNSNPRRKFQELIRRQVRTAVKKGTIHKTPCVVCGNPETQAHHNDYTKPLDIIWLCSTHHSQFHQLIRQDPNSRFKLEKILEELTLRRQASDRGKNKAAQ